MFIERLCFEAPSSDPRTRELHPICEPFLGFWPVYIVTWHRTMTSQHEGLYCLLGLRCKQRLGLNFNLPRITAEPCVQVGFSYHGHLTRHAVKRRSHGPRHSKLPCTRKAAFSCPIGDAWCFALQELDSQHQNGAVMESSSKALRLRPRGPHP